MAAVEGHISSRKVVIESVALEERLEAVGGTTDLPASYGKNAACGADGIVE